MNEVVAVEVPTARTRTHVLRAGNGSGGPVVVLVHGNASSSRFYRELMCRLPGSWTTLAPDLRGFGRSAPDPVDATRGLRDFADDLAELLAHPALELAGRPLHLVGWSLGGGVVMQWAIDRPAQVASVTLLASMSPYGVGGTRDERGTWCQPDAAGSGGGAVAPEFVRRLAARDESLASPLSPRAVMRSLYFRPPFVPDRVTEAAYLRALLATATGPDNYPGDAEPSANWPGFRPGRRGVLNAVSPRFCNLEAFADVASALPVLWLRGDSDLVVADGAAADVGRLGAAGVIAGWPGATFPPQPMIGQMRHVLQRARRAGGTVAEVRLDRCGHSPHIEKPGEVRALLEQFVEEAHGAT
jgi:pimeloyl-ACP methyl ester carboxylesterase